MIVAIDGPAGAGKSTVARAVADRLGYTYVDTGALYRTVTWAALQAGTPIEDGAHVADIARALDIRLAGPRTFADGRDVTDEIRSAEVTSAVSRVAAHAAVRAVLARTQRGIADRSDVVMEGRDIGSTIAPDAQVKIFLTASLEQRAKRRLEQLGLQVDPSSLRDAAQSIECRDRVDEQRAESPLVRPDDAVVIDSTHRSPQQIVDEIVTIAEIAIAKARADAGAG